MARWSSYPAAGRKQSKYHSREVTVAGQKFDSRKEGRRYAELLALQKAGMISGLRRQVKYLLVPAQREPDRTGKKGGTIRGRVIEREIAYYADFVYEENGYTVVEDTKGFKTPDYIIKRKLMLYFYQIRIREV